MRAYTITTGVLFLAVTGAHIWRMVVEPNLAGEPWYLLITLITALLAGWAGRLMFRA